MEKISFIIPFYNEKDVIPTLIERLTSLTGDINAVAEFIFVDDGSTDGGTSLIEKEGESNPSFKLLVLSRNFGHQAAISAGMDFARGDYICIMDADLQDPPEEVVGMLACARNGADVVYAVRKQRRASFSMRAWYNLYYRLLRALADTEISLDSGDFCLINRKALDALLKLPEQQRFIRGLRSWVGFKQRAWEYTRPERAAGRSKYTFKALFRLGFDGIFSFSTKPLRFATYLGLILAAFCFAQVVYAICWRFFSGESLPGFATVTVGIFFLGAVQLVGIGILGEYLSRVYLEVKGRPTYIMARTVNLENSLKREDHSQTKEK
jgi:glycosyltransferase involved in cell wall biosynthesis